MNLLGAKKDSRQIGIYDSLPFLYGCTLRLASYRDPGIVYQNIDAPERLERLCDDTVDLSGRAHIGERRQCAAPVLADLVGHRVETAPAACALPGNRANAGALDVGQDEIGAFAGQPPGDRAPEAVLATTARDHRDLTGESSHGRYLYHGARSDRQEPAARRGERDLARAAGRLAALAVLALVVLAGAAAGSAPVA